MNTIKMIVCGIAVMAVAGSAQAQVNAVELAKKLKIQGVKKMEVVLSEDTYYAAVDVEFVNSGDQSVKFNNGIITVSFDSKSGIKHPYTSAARNAPHTRKQMTTIGPDGKLTVVKIVDDPLVASPIVTLGTITLGDKIVPDEVATLQDCIVSPIELNATPGKPNTVTQTLYVNMGKKGDPNLTDRITSIANVMGDPANPAVMKLEINSRTALGFEGNWLDDNVVRKIELKIVPSMPRDYLFK